ncbi:ABC transporter substrate-binding protein [Halobacteriovorax sp. HLS]|uniref:ABC transporter substrate-binding protein n=1 Tax=Halobacteriovorax sp. HLS TaxID=2234000 RepID=UPI000FDB36F0|nr:ABC transporter substrate-binding protein [Halobacteriovorax sp. HLS]
MRNILNILILVSFVSCSGISMLSGVDPKDLYTEKFMTFITSVKEEYKKGQSESALKKLQAYNTENLLPSEQALRRNLIGVINFSEKNYEQAIYNFELAVGKSRLDKALTAQIQLNLSSSFYKLGYLDKAYATLAICEFKNLQKAEAKKFHKLYYSIATELDKPSQAMKSIIWYLSDIDNLSGLKSQPMYQKLMNSFFQLTSNEKRRILQEFEDEPFLVVGYLGYLESEKLYYGGSRDDAKDLLSWVDSKYANFAEIELLIANFKFRLESFTKMNPFSIGVILPSSGEKLEFGKRALVGIDNGIRELNKNIENGPKYEVFLKDSEGSGVVGAYRVKELVEKHYVSVIIGGLFSSEATKEYLEAKRHGVLFISLSQIYLPKEEKNHLLLEIPGSVESLVNNLFSEDMLNHFGKRAAVIYPDSERGQAYVDEFWRKAKIHDVKVTEVKSYDKNKTDHRETIQKLLGLKYKRERQEELDIMEDIHSLEKSSSTRRIQTLKPIVDFDWAFVPAFPNEALQIIPSFTYFDAFNLNLIGGPSWRSKALSRESHKLGSLYFIGDDFKIDNSTFVNNFIDRYKVQPRLIEMRAYDAFNVLNTILAESSITTRDELEMLVRSREEIVGLTGTWTLQDNVWLKQMVPLKLRRGKIEPVQFVKKEDEKKSL